ncbi:hypothetical protein BBK36DRAFT_1144900 [Trichoderma citrinoviride]|uniref:Uncharacterized protein n=1 Tax=Trichoderma citrinoviride TaxID=58853 RepID=A0A2T4AZH6_9HYPO|nr:hypothetical protein BBK36DRAFT_1144900 [Trichoderma citrinoviride]PTB62475.1 hypothetical protein BBK36DRAFT_1144900 [Trichoderma citrinoviride]
MNNWTEKVLAGAKLLTALQTEVERRSKRRKRQQRKEERQPKEGHTSRYIPDLQPIAPSGTPLLEPIGRDPGHSLSGSLAAEHASMMISYDKCDAVLLLYHSLYLRKYEYGQDREGPARHSPGHESKTLQVMQGKAGCTRQSTQYRNRTGTSSSASTSSRLTDLLG